MAHPTEEFNRIAHGLTPAEELRFIEAEILRRRYVADPVVWASHRLGDILWSKQRTIIESVRDFRKTAVQSAHSIGKSRIAAVTAGWWIDTHKPGDAFVVTSAPTMPQVRAILWREIGRVHARGRLRGRVNQVDWWMSMPDGNEELVAFGRKPDDYDPTAFQGIHARHVLYILDEACGIPNSLWEAADSLIANDYSKALVIGNPDDPMTQFAEVCKPGSGWNTIRISAFDSPNFTGENIPQDIKDRLVGRLYVEEKRRKWAATWVWDGVRYVPPAGTDPNDANPLWYSKVLGEFPQLSQENGLIPIHWIRAAQERHLLAKEPVELGVDVGGGGDSSTIAVRRGAHVRIIREDRNPDTMQTTGNVVAALDATKAIAVKVDSIGIGKGVSDRLRELKKPVLPISVGDQALDTEHYANLRAELWWNVRERFETGEIDIDPYDEDLAAELCSLRYSRLSNGKIQIESKDQAKRRGIASPNRADALMLAFASQGRRGPMQVVTLAGFGR